MCSVKLQVEKVPKPQKSSRGQMRKSEKYISIHFGAEASRQPVPIARHRLDQAAGGQRAQLPAQLKDRVFHGVQAAVGGFAPDGLIDGFFGQDLAGRVAEEPQHLKFLGGEAELLPIQGGVMPGRVHTQDGPRHSQTPEGAGRHAVLPDLLQQLGQVVKSLDLAQLVMQLQGQRLPV